MSVNAPVPSSLGKLDIWGDFRGVSRPGEWWQHVGATQGRRQH